MSVEDAESHRLHFAEFSLSRSWPNIRLGNIYFRVFFKISFFVKIRAYSERC